MMKTICLSLFLVGAFVQESMSQIMPPLPEAKEGARPPVKEVDGTKTDLWNLSFKLHEHENLERIERTAAVEVGYAFSSVAYHLSIYLHLVDATKIGEDRGLELEEFDGPLRKSAFEIARAVDHQSGKCDYWMKAVKNEALRKEILAGQKAMNEISSLLKDYFSGTALEQDNSKSTEQDAADQHATAPESKPEGKEKPKPESGGHSQ